MVHQKMVHKKWFIKKRFKKKDDSNKMVQKTWVSKKRFIKNMVQKMGIRNGNGKVNKKWQSMKINRH